MFAVHNRMGAAKTILEFTQNHFKLTSCIPKQLWKWELFKAFWEIVLYNDRWNNFANRTAQGYRSATRTCAVLEAICEATRTLLACLFPKIELFPVFGPNENPFSFWNQTYGRGMVVQDSAVQYTYAGEWSACNCHGISTRVRNKRAKEGRFMCSTMHTDCTHGECQSNVQYICMYEYIYIYMIYTNICVCILLVSMILNHFYKLFLTHKLSIPPVQDTWHLSWTRKWSLTPASCRRSWRWRWM